MKLCKDCRWFRPQDQGQPLCGHPTSRHPPKVNLVTGEPIPGRVWTCTDLRAFLSFDEFCGEEGRHWEQADTAPVGFT
jgi:hypothetical protein